MSFNFIKNIVDGNVSDFEHKKFTRFSKGRFEREIIKINLVAQKIKVSSGFEYNDVLQKMLSKIFVENKQVDSINVKGSVFSKSKEKPDVILNKLEIDFETKGKKRIIDETMSPDKFKEFVNSIGNFYSLLNIKAGIYSLSVKKSLPKPGKLIENFCKAIFSKSDLDFIHDEFLFDTKEDFKKAIIKHTYLIEDIIIPEKYKDDVENMRIMSKRKGEIIRDIEVNGESFKKEYKFNV